MRAVRNRIMAGSLAALLLVATGCATVSMTDEFNGLKISDTGKSNVTHLHGKVAGLYLLWIPLITGNPDRPGLISIAFLKDGASLTAVSDMISQVAEEEGATHMIDVTSNRDSIWIAPLFVLFWQNAEMSASAVK